MNRYVQDAEALSAYYESKTFAHIHADVLDILPAHAGLVLDVGAGSGRDAAWFAGQGHEVVAVEPVAAMRARARSAHPHARIHWCDDRLPGLTKTTSSGSVFDLIWASAVWMHIPPRQRQRAFRKLVAVLKPGGKLIISLRHGPSPIGQKMYPAHSDEIEQLARAHGLTIIRIVQADDKLGRPDVHWQTICLQAPDDGLGALPLLRHIIINDQKSSTYKLALLRVLARIAASATGLVEDIDDDTVAVPLGLVALYWVRSFKSLVEHGIPQKPINRKGTSLSFVKKHGFGALREISPYRLRIGCRFSGSAAHAVFMSLRDALNTIVKMPAYYITYPGEQQAVFVPHRKAQAKLDDFTLNAAFLKAFGDLHVPRTLWSAMSRYASWIEPVIINEWIDLMQSYERADQRTTYDQHFDLLRWLQPTHDTGEVRQLVMQIKESQPLYCLWSGKKLKDAFAIDHCLPFSAWPCNDLWNLFPSNHNVNQKKSSYLPSAESLAHSRERILDWWGLAYIAGAAAMKERFISEAQAALPKLLSDTALLSPENIFARLMLQRAQLKNNQQLKEW